MNPVEVKMNGEGINPPLEYETPLGHGGEVMGSLSYRKQQAGGVVVVAHNNQPMGKWKWVERVAMGLAVAVMVLMLAAGISQTRRWLDLGVMRVQGNSYLFLAGALVIVLVLLKLALVGIARYRRQRVVIDVNADGLIIRKESAADGQQEAQSWKREEINSIFGDEALVVTDMNGRNYVVEVGKTLEEREWLARTLREALHPEREVGL
jgi:uncharacterized membrane protein